MALIPVDTTGIAAGDTLVWDGSKLIPGPASVLPVIGADLVDLGTPVDGKTGIVRLGSGDDVHEEIFIGDGSNWIGRERVILTTTDSWAMDLSRCPIANFANAWAKFSGGVGWQILGGRTALRSSTTLPTGTINVKDWIGYGGAIPASGTVFIRDQLITFTGVVTTPGAMQLTGCTGGTGTFPADITPVIPATIANYGGGDSGGWGTMVVPLDRCDELYDAGFVLEERANCWVNGSCDLKRMTIAPHYLNYDLGEDMGAAANYPRPNLPPIAGMLGPGIQLQGPPYDMAGYTVPGSHNRADERGFEQRHAAWTAWASADPTKRFLLPTLYGKMETGAQDNGEVYGYTLRVRWVSP